MIANALPRPITAGSVDNAILRADGTGGSALQNSGLVVDDTIISFTSITGVASTDIITATGSAFANGQPIRFTSLTGGTGARWLGIGTQTAYTQDVVVISLRLVSVQTGEVLTTVTVEKNLLSTADGVTALKFFNQATKAFEFDSSQTFNEPGNYALRSAIETAVIELIKKGERNGLWQFKEKSNELVQTQTKTKDAAKTASTPLQPNSGKGVEGSKEKSIWTRIQFWK